MYKVHSLLIGLATGPLPIIFTTGHNIMYMDRNVMEIPKPSLSVIGIIN